MTNKSLWYKISALTLVILGSAIFSYATIGTHKIQANSFTGSNIEIQALAGSYTVNSGDTPIAIYSITITDATGLGSLQSVNAMLTTSPTNGASFTN